VLHDARRAARTTRDGDIVLLDDQDRSLWDREQIAEGAALVVFTLRTPGGLLDATRDINNAKTFRFFACVEFSPSS